MKQESPNLNDLASELLKLTERIEKVEENTQYLTTVTDSTVSQIIISVVPLVGVTLGLVLLFFFFLWQYRLRKALIASAQYEPPSLRYLKILSLLGGLVLTVMGFSMSLMFILKYGISNILLGGLIPLSVGIAMLLFYAITRHQDD